MSGLPTPYDQAALDEASRELHMFFLREGSRYGTKACEEIGRVFMTAYQKAASSEIAPSTQPGEPQAPTTAGSSPAALSAILPNDSTSIPSQRLASSEARPDTTPDEPVNGETHQRRVAPRSGSGEGVSQADGGERPAPSCSTPDKQNEPDGYAVLMDDKASAPAGFWFCGIWTTKEVAEQYMSKQRNVRMAPMFFASSPQKE